MARFNINVNCVCPDDEQNKKTDTRCWRWCRRSTGRLPSRHAMGRLAKPSEIADAVLFFVSSRADFVTGQTLSVSGGLTWQVNARVSLPPIWRILCITQSRRVAPQHFKWEVKDRIGTITLNRPERKNPLTLESYASCATRSINCNTPKTCGWCIHRRGRQLLLRRRCARDHRSPHAHGYERADRVYSHDGKPGQGNAQSAHSHHCGGRRNQRRGGAIIPMASDLRYGTPDARPHFRSCASASRCDMVPAQFCPVSSDRVALRAVLHRARDDGAGRARLGLFQ